MSEGTTRAVGSLLSTLQERAKELNCLYRIEELLSQTDLPLEEVFRGIIEIIPPGWQHSAACQAIIVHEAQTYEPPDFVETQWTHCSVIRVQDQPVGKICVSYKEECPSGEEGPFLKEEIKLIETIADRLGHFILHKRLKLTFQELTEARRNGSDESRQEWRVALGLLRKTDKDLLIRISRKMMNFLCWSGINEARSLLLRYGQDQGSAELVGEMNRPQEKTPAESFLGLVDETFRVAAAHLSDNEILRYIEQWIQEDRSGFFVKALINRQTPLDVISDAIHRYQYLLPEGITLSAEVSDGLRVALVRRFLTDQLDYIKTAKRYVEIEDFFDLMNRIIFPAGTHGTLGGKSAGLFLAHKILKKAHAIGKVIGEVKTPKTWYITSDGLPTFLQYNNLEEVNEQKYKEIHQVRQEYPHLVQVFKNCHFPQETVKGLSLALDDFGDVPLIVRSSSLLEDRLGSSFSGKYKSLFLANQGSKEQRLDALLDAIAEIYASTFAHDAIEYRAKRGLLDFDEEMGIMIQEVIGTHIGRYFMPAFAGVAFSENEFRWSPRIKREDGLLRLVPGLGTRAVDRLGDDYPILLAPSKPKLQVNMSIDEIIRYSPKKIDLINMETNRFETKEIQELLRECGQEYPSIHNIVSVHRDGFIRRPLGLTTDFNHDDLVVTFQGLITTSSFVGRIEAMLKSLEQAFGSPVDIEFASDGADLYLLQCRAQSSSRDDTAVEIPQDVPDESVLFTARRHVSNGRVPDLTHIVYVVPEEYDELSEYNDLLAVGRAVGRLNELLPKRQFVLMGPGRWGSRGDIKLGVNVTYSDINNTAVLIEIAREKGSYVPDLSFGTHFFQDLVEASIRYLPLYPDDNGVRFNEDFLLSAPNILPKVLPEYSFLSDAIRVIDIPDITEGRILRILMNADREEAMGLFAERSTPVRTVDQAGDTQINDRDEHWRWRLRMAERIGGRLDPSRFGVKAFYVLGSSKNATAGPASDLDLLIHFEGTEKQRKDLDIWLEGWSICLAEQNYLRTGYSSDGLLDIHIVTDEEIARRSDFAVKIGAITDPARQLPLKGQS